VNETAEKTDKKGRATKLGRVVSDKMNKTIVVEVERRVQHAEYTRTIKRTSRFHAHDEANAAKVGDRVRIEETRPLSKLKRWRLREIVTKAQG
jgi:small subunit ribosomal protein S17